MRINNIRFSNFRCFLGYTLGFKQSVNLLFGANGSGKTTILRGLKIAMSSYFSGFSDVNTRFIGISNDDFMSISIRPLRKKVYFEYVDGREVDSSNLSDGYKRLANIVTDLAFRCCLLNGKKYGTDCCRYTSGIVLIDEIDLHLHPELQSVVLKSLHNTFPKLQFVVSSHAPMVMSSVMTDDVNEVLHLQYKDGEYTASPISTYGLDASTILSLYMGNKSRVAEVEENLKKRCPTRI